MLAATLCLASLASVSYLVRASSWLPLSQRWRASLSAASWASAGTAKRKTIRQVQRCFMGASLGTTADVLGLTLADGRGKRKEMGGPCEVHTLSPGRILIARS